MVVEVIRVGNHRPASGGLSIFIEGSFDYAHFLPCSEKCFPLHSHTSAVELELKGKADKSGMVMDFTDARTLLNEVLSEVDHKLVASRAHCTREGDALLVKYKEFLFRLPPEHVFLLDGEGTVENVAWRLAESIMSKLPKNISWMRLTITEGLRKGSSVVMERHS